METRKDVRKKEHGVCLGSVCARTCFIESLSARALGQGQGRPQL
jgi:hypothetical protein